MKKLEVGDKVLFDGVECEISHVNGDETFRLKSDDTNHPNYNDGSIGCFSLDDKRLGK